jgi:uncharacterized protein
MNRPVHFEILTQNPEKMIEFYRETLGWQPPSAGGPERYWPLTTGPESMPGINGGIMDRHFPQAVINTISVTSLDDTLAKVGAAGGKLVHGPKDIPGIGKHAYCTDPDGTYFGVLEPIR